MAVDRFYLCSGVFIAHIRGDEEHSAASSDLLLAAREGHFVLHTSFLTMTEVLASERSRVRRTKDGEAKITELMDADYIVYSAVEQLVAETSRFVNWDYQIKAADAVHVATAIKRDCVRFYTTDKPLQSNSGASNGRVILPEIRFPEHISRQTSLPFASSE